MTFVRGKWLAPLAFTSHGLSSKQAKRDPSFGTVSLYPKIPPKHHWSAFHARNSYTFHVLLIGGAWETSSMDAVGGGWKREVFYRGRAQEESATFVEISEGVCFCGASYGTKALQLWPVRLFETTGWSDCRNYPGEWISAKCN